MSTKSCNNPSITRNYKTVKEAKQKEKRRDIQGIRGVAIVYVLLFHMFPKQFPHGFLGVDMFFVISGFLITMILRREDELTCSDVMIFFKKRIKRIFPAYYLVLVLIIICGLTTLASSDFRLLKTDTLWAVGFATNFHKYFQGLDYFAQVANFDFLLHTWSLAVEIQFYVVAPILILMSRHFVGKYFFCSSLFIASVWFNLTATGQLQFSSLPSRIWQFMCGGIAYTYSVGQFPSWTVAVPLFIVSPITLLLPLSDTVFRFLVTFASAFIISANNNFLNKYILGNDLLYFIGEISYSVYLFHWPIILFLKYSSNVDELSFKDAVFGAELSILLGFLSYKLVERIFLENRFRFTVSFIVLSVALILSTNFIKLDEEFQETLNATVSNETEPTKTRFERACYQFLDVPYLPVNVTQSMRERAIKINRDYLVEVVPVLKKKYNLSDPLYEKYFTKTRTFMEFPDYYKGNGTLKIVVIGNSYARSGFIPVINAFREYISEIRLLCNSACQPFINSTEYAVGRYKKQCPGFLDQSLLLVEDMKPDIVFFIFKPMYGLIKDIENIETDQQTMLMQKTVDRISKATKVILIQMPLPAPPRSYSRLLLKVLEMKQSFEGLYWNFSEFRQNIHSALRRMEHVHCDKCIKIYAHKIFCDSEICRVFDPDNLISFFDQSSHFNPYSQRCLTRLYRDTLFEALADNRFSEEDRT